VTDGELPIDPWAMRRRCGSWPGATCTTLAVPAATPVLMLAHERSLERCRGIVAGGQLPAGSCRRAGAGKPIGTSFARW